MPPGQSGDRSRAEAIGDPGQLNHVRVAGSNESDERVYVWEYNGVGAWSAPNLCVVDVHDAVVSCGQTLTFDFTHDMNNNGHVLVHARDPSNTAHLVILGCVADINHDMRVNGADRDLMHLAYGPCADCNECPADLDCDCDVDATDFAQLLATWSATAPCRITNFCDDPEGGEGFAGGGQSLDDALAQALEYCGFSSAEEFLAWTESVDAAQADDACELIHLLMTE